MSATATSPGHETALRIVAERQRDRLRDAVRAAVDDLLRPVRRPRLSRASLGELHRASKRQIANALLEALAATEPTK